jgi:hypothetical protein
MTVAAKLRRGAGAGAVSRVCGFTSRFRRAS